MVNVYLLPCCKPRLLEQESRRTARNSVDMREKVLEDSENEEQEQEATSDEDVTREKMNSEERRRKTRLSLCAKTYTNQSRLIIVTVKLFVLI